MGRLGISIYPEHSTPDKDKAYLTMAANYGFSRVFTCLLSVNKEVEEIKKEFKEVTEHANGLGFEVIVDVAPNVFKNLNISYDDLSFFKDIGAAGFRLDEGFGGSLEAKMSYNPEGLKVELNASNPGYYINNIMTYQPDKSKLLTCHNFYPQKYSGLSFKIFQQTGENIRSLGLPIAAFVSSQNIGTYGPWPVNEGLCTLEIHRDLPIDAQARHLFATGLVDDVIIANCYPSEEELQRLSKINPALLTMGIKLEDGLSDVEKEIIFEFKNSVRADMSDYMARSTMPRIVYGDSSIPVGNTRDLKRGDVVIVNDEYNRYKGELHVILKDMPNDGRKNVVGVIPDYEEMLLEYLIPNTKFTFIEV